MVNECYTSHSTGNPVLRKWLPKQNPYGLKPVWHTGVCHAVAML
jgi:hypothetical protein